MRSPVLPLTWHRFRGPRRPHGLAHPRAREARHGRPGARHYVRNEPVTVASPASSPAAPGTPIRALIADDQYLVRTGFRFS